MKKFYVISFGILLLVLGALFVLTEDQVVIAPSPAPSSDSGIALH